jgi:hypothetical protein
VSAPGNTGHPEALASSSAQELWQKPSKVLMLRLCMKLARQVLINGNAPMPTTGMKRKFGTFFKAVIFEQVNAFGSR